MQGRWQIPGPSAKTRGEMENPVQLTFWPCGSLPPSISCFLPPGSPPPSAWLACSLASLHPRSGSRRLTQPQIQSPRESTSAKSHGDSFRRRVSGRSVRDTAAYRPEKFSAELRGQLRGSGGALMRKGRKDAQDPRGTAPPPRHGGRNLLAALQPGTSQLSSL